MIDESARVQAKQTTATGAHGQLRRGEVRTYRLFLYPSLAILALVTVAPTIYLLLTSFTPLDLTRPATFWDFHHPLGNYILLATDGRFWNSLLVQAKLSVFTVGFQLVLGLAAALMLNQRARFFHGIRTFFLIPMVLPPIVVALIWKVLYTPNISPVYYVFRSLGWNVPTLITSPTYALWSIVIADVWEWFPFTMLMLLAALQMIPEEPLEAARIDGGGAWDIFRYIILPLLRPALLVAGLFRLIDSVKAFPLIFILTQGGPGTVTEVTNYYGYDEGFSLSFLGYSSAITVILVIITFALSWWVIRLVGTESDYE